MGLFGRGAHTLEIFFIHFDSWEKFADYLFAMRGYFCALFHKVSNGFLFSVLVFLRQLGILSRRFVLLLHIFSCFHQLNINSQINCFITKYISIYLIIFICYLYHQSGRFPLSFSFFYRWDAMLVGFQIQ